MAAGAALILAAVGAVVLSIRIDTLRTDGARESVLEHYDATAAPLFSPDGRWLLALGRTAALWPSDPSMGEAQSLGNRFSSAEFSSDGRHLLLIGMFSQGSVRALADPGVTRDLALEVTVGSFSPDGQQIVTTSSPKTMDLMNPPEMSSHWVLDTTR